MSEGPQLEDGYVRVANELYDAILLKLSSYRHIKVVLAIVRKTYGYGKKEDDITISQLAEITGIHRNNVGTALRELEDMHVINPVRPGFHGLLIGLNKHHGQWSCDEVKPRGPGKKAINLIAHESNQNIAPKQSKQLPDAINLIEISNQNVAHKRQPQKTTPKEVAPSERPEQKNAPSASKGERLAEDWTLPADWRAWALQEQPTWSPEHAGKVAASFLDYWIAKPGKDGRKANWEATWRNWVRREAPMRTPAFVPPANPCLGAI